MKNLKALVNSLSKKKRLEILTSIRDAAQRNLEISERLKIRKERVSEALRELVKTRVAVRFEKGALAGEKHPFYVGTPLAKEISDLDERMGRLKELLPSRIDDFGEGIGYLLKYYMEDDVRVEHSTLKTKKGRKVKLVIERDACGKKECDVVCEPLVKAVTKKFGRLDEFHRADCRFEVSLWYGT
ncbi:MAG: hypothetical protein V3W19_05120 [Desulfatiglandales bacterium]